MNDHLDDSAVGHKALAPNPALAPLAFLIGSWRTEGRHPMMPGVTLQGRTTFAWHEGGAFVVMHGEVDHPQFPDGVAIIGSDNHARRFTMIYFDERGLSRHYEIEVGDGTVTWRRDDPELAQSLTIRAEPGGDKLISQGRMSMKGGPWGDDLSQVFSRLSD